MQAAILDLNGALAAVQFASPGPLYTRGWDRLLQCMQPIVHAIARRDFGLSGEDSEDVFQMVCVKVFERLRQLQDPSRFRGWLRQLTRRVIVDFMRQRKDCLPLECLETGPEAQKTPGDRSWMERLSLRLDLEKALLRLPDKYRLPVVLHLVEGAPQEEVSQRLGRPRSTIATQIQRGLARLRRLLAPTTEP